MSTSKVKVMSATWHVESLRILLKYDCLYSFILTRHAGSVVVSLTLVVLQIDLILLQDIHNQLGSVRTFLFLEIFDPKKTLLYYPSFINTIVENKGGLFSMRDVRRFIDKNGIVYGHMSFFNYGTVDDSTARFDKFILRTPTQKMAINLFTALLGAGNFF